MPKIFIHFYIYKKYYETKINGKKTKSRVISYYILRKNNPYIKCLCFK